MSTLILDELFNGVTFEQHIHLTQSTSFPYIRVWIYKHGILTSGDLKLDVYDGVSLVKSVSIPYTDINTAIPATYAHGYIRFDMDPLLLAVRDDETSHEYILKFSMANYIDDVNKFIAVVREWENPKYIPIDTPLSNDSIAACGLELYSYR